MEKLSFIYNWNNKLYCDAFTSIRLSNPRKYYIGAEFEVHLKNSFLKRARVIGIHDIYLTQLNEFMARIDTGYSLDNCLGVIQKMYPKVNFLQQKIMFILFETF